MRWGIKTIDDRGRRVRLLPVYRAAFFPVEAARALPQETRRGVLDSQRVPGIALAIVGWVLGLVFCTSGFGLLPTPGSIGLHGPLAAATVVALYTLSLWFIAWAGGKLNRLLRHRAIADQILATGHCASCCRAISHLMPQPDRCTLCPECGAAWRTERLLPANPVAATIGPELWGRE